MVIITQLGAVISVLMVITGTPGAVSGTLMTITGAPLMMQAFAEMVFCHVFFADKNVRRLVTDNQS